MLQRRALSADPSSFDSTLTGTAEAADINSIDFINGDGVINGVSLTEINGEASEVVGVLGTYGGTLNTDPASFDSALRGASNASDITSIESANGNGSIDGVSITELNGSAADVVQAIEDLDVDPNSFDSTLNGVAEASDISSIETVNGNGSIDGTSSEINGSATALFRLFLILTTFLPPLIHNSLVER